MTQQEKRELKMNKLLDLIKEKSKEKNLTQESANRLTIASFMYGCGRRNDLEIIAIMTYVCITEKLLDINEICQALKDQGVFGNDKLL